MRTKRALNDHSVEKSWNIYFIGQATTSNDLSPTHQQASNCQEGEHKIKTFCEFNNPADALQVLAEFNALEDQDSLLYFSLGAFRCTAASFCGAPWKTRDKSNAFVADLVTAFFWTALNSDENTHRVAQQVADGSETALLTLKAEDLTVRALPFASSFAHRALTRKPHIPQPMTTLPLTSNQTETVLGLLQQVLYHGLADRYVDDDAQFLALGDIYDRLTEQQEERRKGVQLPAFESFV